MDANSERNGNGIAFGNCVCVCNFWNASCPFSLPIKKEKE